MTALSAAAAPIFIHVAVTHRSHWYGGGAGPYWGSFVLPWTVRIWSLVVLVAVAGWAAGARSEHPVLLKRARRGGIAGAAGAIVAGVAALPSWIWIVRLNVTEPSEFLLQCASGWLAALLGAVTAGAIGAFVPVALAAGLGLATGGALVWMMLG